MTSEEMDVLNTKLASLAEMSLAHQAFLEDYPDELVVSIDTTDFVELEDAFLFLYDQWKIFTSRPHSETCMCSMRKGELH